jgi:hypothetical protein
MTELQWAAGVLDACCEVQVGTDPNGGVITEVKVWVDELTIPTMRRLIKTLPSHDTLEEDTSGELSMRRLSYTLVISPTMRQVAEEMTDPVRMQVLAACEIEKWLREPASKRKELSLLVLGKVLKHLQEGGSLWDM